MENCNKIVLVTHCLLTKGFSPQYRNDMKEVLYELLDCGAGIIQIPCPHLIMLCEGKERKTGFNSLLGKLSSQSLDNLYSRALSPFVKEVEEYKKQGFEICGIVGVKNSPACEIKGIEENSKYKQGTFMEILKRKLKEKAIQTNMVNVNIPSECYISENNQ